MRTLGYFSKAPFESTAILRKQEIADLELRDTIRFDHRRPPSVVAENGDSGKWRGPPGRVVLMWRISPPGGRERSLPDALSGWRDRRGCFALQPAESEMVIRAGLPIVVVHLPRDRAGGQLDRNRVSSIGRLKMDAAPRHDKSPRPLEGPPISVVQQRIRLLLALQTQCAGEFVIEIQRERVAGGIRDEHQTTQLDHRVLPRQRAFHDVFALSRQVEVGFADLAHFTG